MNIRLEEDLNLSPEKFTFLKDKLFLLFPGVFNIHKDFLIRLTPEELKRAYIQQAANCHPASAQGLNQDERAARQLRYQRLSSAYKSILPYVRNIHEKIREIELRETGIASSLEGGGRTILAIGGAKGGVGKTILATNLAVGLALLGQRVVLADLDLGGADAHLLLGVKTLTRDWNDLLEKKAETLEELLTRTPFEGISLIGGNSAKLGSANVTYLQKLKIIRQLKALDCDYVVVDLGGDTSFNVLDFFLLADHKIVVTAAEPASFLDTYNFVKVAFYRFLDRFFKEHSSLKELCEQIAELSLGKNSGLTLESVIQEVRIKDPSAYIELRQALDEYRLSIVVNMADTRKDAGIAESMQRLLKKKFLPDVGILGTVPFDMAVRRAARRFMPFLVEDPKCNASKVIHKMLAAILLLREPESIRTELLEKTRLIRHETRNQVGGGGMTLDGLTDEQVRFISERLPTLRQGFRKVLGLAQN